jgi:signal transduction histidine kinase
VIASDVTTDHNWVQFRDLADVHGLRSCWSTPIVAEGGEVLGTFAVYSADVWAPDQAAVQLVERFTYLAAIAIEHHRLFGADASNKAKTDFLALVSHELRTPLNAILGFAQVMQMVDLEPEQRVDSVDQIVRAGQHLRDLIDELLDLSRIEAGQLSVVAEDIATDTVVGEVLDLVRPLAASRDIELIERHQTGAHRVHADQRCVRQVLINLVANAVKYTPVGGRIRVESEATTEEMVRISVTDSGPGISSESMADLFKPFHRLRQDDGTEPKGTGLGLALSARLVDEMDGRIGVESTPGTGSCFWVELQRTQPTPSVASAPATESDSRLPGRSTVPLRYA